MTSKLMLLLVATNAPNVLVSDAVHLMTVSMPSWNNWEIGMTMDSNFARMSNPFTYETLDAFQSAYETKKEEGKWDQSGMFQMTARLVESEEDKLRTIGVEESMELSYMMFSVCSWIETGKLYSQSQMQLTR